jgi:hypothetical protein
MYHIIKLAMKSEASEEEHAISSSHNILFTKEGVATMSQ